MMKIDEIADPLLELNIRVAAIAGWENIEEWNPNPKTEKPKRTFTGTNKKHPELGIFVPDYVRDLNAIAKVFLLLKLQWSLEVAWDGRSYAADHHGNEYVAETPAIALCKLLLRLKPKSGDFVTIAGLEIET